MQRISLLPIAAVLALSISGAATAQERSFDLTGFDRLDISTGLDAVVSMGDSFSIRAEARNQHALDNLHLDVSGNTLRARFEQSFFDFIISGGLVGQLFSGGSPVRLAITMPALAGIDASAGAHVTAASVTSPSLDLDAASGSDIAISGLTVGRLQANASSGSDIALSGTCDGINADASSGGNIDAEDLTCTDAVLDASSGADIALQVTGRLKANASSGADIDISGQPTSTDIDQSSGGDVELDD